MRRVYRCRWAVICRRSGRGGHAGCAGIHYDEFGTSITDAALGRVQSSQASLVVRESYPAATTTDLFSGLLRIQQEEFARPLGANSDGIFNVVPSTSGSINVDSPQTITIERSHRMGVRTVFIVSAGIFGVLLVAVGLVVLIGNRRWQSETQRLHDLQGDVSGRAEESVYQPETLSGLPGPVKRYLETVLSPGQPIVASAQIKHTGTFNMDESGEQWRPFHSTQQVVTNDPSFIWDGRVRVLPGVNAHVHDAYVDGTGILYVAVWGLIPVADIRDTPEIARGELMRYLAEAAWYPTALLPGQGVTWSAVNEHSAEASLTDGDISVTLRFHFDSDNLIESVYAPDRERTVGDSTEPTPWEGRFTNYGMRDGMLVPTDGDVGWILPTGRLSYWRGHIEQLSYEFH